MKKILCVLFILINSVFYAESIKDTWEKVYEQQEGESLERNHKTNKSKEQKKYVKRVMILAKPGYFYPQDSTFRKIYGQGNFIIQGEVDVNVAKGWHAWIDSGFFYDKGKVKSVDATTKVYIVPSQVGAKYVFREKTPIQPFIRAGGNWVHVENKQRYPYVPSKKKSNMFGFVIGTGCLFKFYDMGVLSIFIDYMYDRKKIHDSNSDTTFSVYSGGLVTGLGLGIEF